MWVRKGHRRFSTTSQLKLKRIIRFNLAIFWILDIAMISCSMYGHADISERVLSPAITWVINTLRTPSIPRPNLTNRHRKSPTQLVFKRHNIERLPFMGHLSTGCPGAETTALFPGDFPTRRNVLSLLDLPEMYWTYPSTSGSIKGYTLERPLAAVLSVMHCMRARPPTGSLLGIQLCLTQLWAIARVCVIILMRNIGNLFIFNNLLLSLSIYKE